MLGSSSFFMQSEQIDIPAHAKKAVVRFSLIATGRLLLPFIDMIKSLVEKVGIY
jgi:hypothetical protein